MRGMRRIVRGAVIAALIVLIGTGCRELPRHLAPGQVVAFSGQLAAGAECAMIVADHDRRFSLAGDLGRFKPGDRVCVRGTVAAMSMCMAGEATISVERI